MKLKEDAQRLWELCFDDSLDFIRFYFDKVYIEEQTHIIYSPMEEALAHVQTPLYRLNCLGASFSVNYISGACTHPDYRGQGLMQELILASIRWDMHRHGIVASLLIPANKEVESYYTKHFGYLPLVENVLSNGWSGLSWTSEENSASSLLASLASWEEQKQHNGLVHSQEQWQHIMEEYAQFDNAYIFTNWEETKPEEPYFALCRLVEEVETTPLLIIDRVFGSTKGRKLLRELLEQRFPEYQVRIYHIADVEGRTIREPKGMIRIVTIRPFLEQYAKVNPERMMSFTLEDNLFPENNGTFMMTSGQIRYAPSIQDSLPRYTPCELTSLLLHPLQASLLHE